MATTINFTMLEDNIGGAVRCSCLSLPSVGYKIPISNIGLYESLEELNNPGIYILYNSKTLENYIGKSDTNVMKDIIEYIEKGFCDTIIIFIMSAKKLEVRFLNYLNSKLKNEEISSEEESVTPKEEIDLENILKSIQIYSTILGFHIDIDYNNKSTLYEVIDDLYILEDTKYKALATKSSSNEMVILAGSYINTRPLDKSVYSRYYSSKHISASGIIIQNLKLGLVQSIKLVAGIDYTPDKEWKLWKPNKNISLNEMEYILPKEEKEQ